MQRYDRDGVNPPRFLRDKEVDAARRDLLDLFSGSLERRAQTSVSRRRVNLEHRSVVEGLSRVFHGKCAFCEAPDAGGVHRFRPPAEARPVRQSDSAHLYYAWLSEAWENLYLICATCRPEEPDWFPVTGDRVPLPTLKEVQAYVDEGAGRWRPPIKERPLLLDPCQQKGFASHLHAQADGALIGIGPRGEATVEHFRLDRLERRHDRAEAIADYIASLLQIVDPAMTTPPGAEVGPEIFDFRDLAFGGAWYLYLRRVAAELGRRAGRRPRLSQAEIGGYLLQSSGRPEARRDLVAVLDALARQDKAGPPTRRVAYRPHLAGSRLTRIEVRSFKGLETLDLDLSPRAAVNDSSAAGQAPALLILGENAAGKSTILEAVALALSSGPAREELELDLKGLRLDPAFMGATDVHPAAYATVTLRFDDGAHRRLVIDDLGLRSEGQEAAPPVFAYGAFRQYLKGRRRYSPARSIVSLFHTDSVLTNPEEWLLRLKEVEFNAVVRTLRVILSVEGEFDVIRRDFAAKRCLVVTSTPGPDGHPIQSPTPLKLVSSGFRSVLAMVCDILQGLMDKRVAGKFETFATARGVILIDEVEAHLHPRWKMQIMSALRRALPGMTIIATTHDPLCLRGMSDGEVVVMHRIAGATTEKTELPLLVEQLTDLPNISTLTVQQLLTSDFFSMFSTDEPETERELAKVVDLLAKRAAGVELSADELVVLERFEADVASALPVGSSEVQREVQAAVAQYLARKRQKSDEQLRALRRETRERIVRALEGV